MASVKSRLDRAVRGIAATDRKYGTSKGTPSFAKVKNAKEAVKMLGSRGAKGKGGGGGG